TQGRLVYRIHVKEDENLFVSGRSYAGGGLVPNLEGQWDLIAHGTRVPLDSRTRWLDKRDFLIKLPKALDGELQLEFRASNNTGQTLLTLNWLEIQSVQASSVLGSAFVTPSLWRVALSTAALLALPWLLSPVWARRVPWELGLILWIGLLLRYQNLTHLIFLGLETDPWKWKQFADRMDLFSSGAGFFSNSFGYREPLFPLICHLFFLVSGSSETHIRLVSALLSLGVIVLSYPLARRFLGRTWAAIITAVVALNPTLIYESGRGNRLELLTLLTLGLVWILSAPGPARFRRVAGAGAWNALSSLALFSNLPASLGTTALGLWREISWRKAVLFFTGSAAVTGLLLSPLALGLSRNNSGVPAKYVYAMVKWELSGAQRWPFSRQIKMKNAPLEMLETSYSDYEKSIEEDPSREISYKDYVFGMHRLPTVLEYTAKGFLLSTLLQGISITQSDLFRWQVQPSPLRRFAILWPKLLHLFFNLLGLWGLGLCLLSPQRRLLPAAILLSLFPITFSLGWRAFEYPRYILQVYPLYLICTAIALSKIWSLRHRTGE
ncbi:MAG: glycosyltransferase family 39 protein, partial [Candidatus Omnitrophica bacterium]|nr:glycosyltransferase family 39 protein [Candidatus Omnitrophota bacterium]